MKKYVLTLGALVFCNIGISFSQVTIGGPIPPAQGALLDIKQQSADADNVTSNKGLLLPRVKLIALNSLQPLVMTASDVDKKQHIGLQVYNVGDIAIKAGVKTWNGQVWEEQGSGGNQWVYMPPFPINMYLTTPQEILLFPKYDEQLNQTKTGSPGLSEAEAKFVITGYDANAFTVAPVVAFDTNGKAVLRYTAKPSGLTTSSYLNIIVIKK